MSQPTGGHKTETIGLIALGSNLKTPNCIPLDRLRKALIDVAEAGLTIRASSRFYHTPFFPANQGADFVNAVAVISGEFSAHEVLACLHQIEEAHDRKREKRWADRTLDIDLIAWGTGVLPDAVTFNRWRDLALEQQKIETPDQLILPHPRLQDRAFVLVPLAEVLPTWKHPVTDESVQDMLDALPESDKSEVIPLEN